jgi:hypothetical protein
MRALPGGWRKASYSSPNGDCVEVARPAGAVVGIRDSKAPDAGQLAVTPAAFDALLRRECELRH